MSHLKLLKYFDKQMNDYLPTSASIFPLKKKNIPMMKMEFFLN